MDELVRDRIPEIIRATGSEPDVRVLTEAELEIALREELVEEALEARSADTEDLVEELADVPEVFDALAHVHRLNMTDV